MSLDHRIPLSVEGCFVVNNFCNACSGQVLKAKNSFSYGVLAIRMEEQNLRGFLICRHFARERHGSFADFILHTAEMSNPLYLKAAKSMTEVCGSKSVIAVECECRVVSGSKRDLTCNMVLGALVRNT